MGIKSNHRVGRFSDASKSKEYHDRIDAINFSLAHDDGQSNRDLAGRRRDPGGRQPQRQDTDIASTWRCSTDSRLPTTR